MSTTFNLLGSSKYRYWFVSLGLFRICPGRISTSLRAELLCSVAFEHPKTWATKSSVYINEKGLGSFDNMRDSLKQIRVEGRIYPAEYKL